MADRQWFGNSKLLILLLLVLAVGIGILFLLSSMKNGNTSPISPLAVEEELNYLDGEGEIEWYENFYVWNPKAQYTSYPFLTGTVAVSWDEPLLNIQPLAIPSTEITITPVMTIELILSSTIKADVYSQILTYTNISQKSPGTGLILQPIWEWWENEPGIYNEYIRGQIDIGSQVLPMYFVRDGEVITPTGYFHLYREDLIVPELTYLPIVMKRAK